MDPEFTKFVDDAANITTSGRWAAVYVEIKRLAANPGVDNEWCGQLFGSLCIQVLSEYQHLKQAYAENREGDASLLTWRARNLLELWVWSRYCSKNREKARCLYDDAHRDVVDLFNAFKKWSQATGQSTDWIELLTPAIQELSWRAAADGVETLDGSYKKGCGCS